MRRLFLTKLHDWLLQHVREPEMPSTVGMAAMRIAKARTLYLTLFIARNSQVSEEYDHKYVRLHNLDRRGKEQTNADTLECKDDAHPVATTSLLQCLRTPLSPRLQHPAHPTAHPP